MPALLAWALSLLCGLAAFLGALAGPRLLVRDSAASAGTSLPAAALMAVVVFAYVRVVLAYPQSLLLATVALVVVAVGAVLFIRSARRESDRKPRT